MDTELREAIRRKDMVGVIRCHVRANVTTQAACERAIALACPVATDYAKEAGLGHLVGHHPLAGHETSEPTESQWRLIVPWVSPLEARDAYQWGIDRLDFWGRLYRQATNMRPGSPTGRTNWEDALAYLREIQNYLYHGHPDQAYRMSRYAWDSVAVRSAQLGPMADSIRDMLVAVDPHKLREWEESKRRLPDVTPSGSASYLHNRVAEAVARTWYHPDEESIRRRSIRAGQQLGTGAGVFGFLHDVMDRARWQNPTTCHLLRNLALRTLGWYTLAPETRQVLESINPTVGDCWTGDERPFRQRPSDRGFVGPGETLPAPR